MDRCVAISTLALLAGTASAQSFNVDFNVTSGNGSGAPSSAYAGAAAQAGAWNNITNSSAASVVLNGLNGAASSVNFAWNKSTTISAGSFDSGLTGDTAKLCQDGQFMTSFGTLQYTFSNLQAGTYAVYTYAGTPANTQQAGVTVTGTTSDYQYVGGNLSDDLFPGVSHGIHIVTVAAGGSVVVKVGDSPFGNASCTGLQLRKIDSSRLRFYVNKAQTANPNTGISWTNAFDDLNPILKQAALIGGLNCEIWVRSGFYYPTTGSDRSATFQIPDGLHLLGGFAGTEVNLSDRTSPVALISGLHGGIGGSAQTDNSYTVVTLDNCTSNTTLDGFYVYRGYNNNSGKGGGMRITGGSPILRDIHFSGNSANLDGGAAYSSGGASPWFIQTTFFDSDCNNGDGGAVYHAGGGTATFTNCTFLGNTALGSAGAVGVNFSVANFEGCLFSGNTAGFGNGGALNIAGNAGHDASLINCTLANNKSSSGSGGGIYINNSSKVVLKNSILWGNTDTHGSALDQNIDTNSSGSYTRSYTTVQGLAGVDGHNPQFANALGGNGLAGDFDDNLNLLETSPCVDAGANGNVGIDWADLDNDGIWFEYTSLDLNLDTRNLDDLNVPDTGAGPGPVVDRGCFEYQYHTCPADFDKSGFVDLDDYVAFVAAFEAGTQNADFDGTGFVDTDDFTAFVLAFEAGC